MAITEEFDSQKLLVDSVNILLGVINELPITSLEDIENILEAQIAVDVILESKKTILGYGWKVNTDTAYPLQPDADGFINVPPHVLDLAVSGSNIIVRDWKLYDKDTFSQTFDAAVECDIVWNLEFNTLPQPIRYYITINAARIFQYRMITDVNMHKFTDKDETMALLAAKRSEGRTGQFNMLSSGSYGSNFNVLG